MDQFLLPFVRTLSEEQLVNALNHVTRESRSAQLNSSEIHILHNLQMSESDPFVVILDELHLHWDWHKKWKVLVIAAFNMDATHCHYLHQRKFVPGDGRHKRKF